MSNNFVYYFLFGWLFDWIGRLFGGFFEEDISDELVLMFKNLPNLRKVFKKIKSDITFNEFLVDLNISKKDLFKVNNHLLNQFAIKKNNPTYRLSKLHKIFSKDYYETRQWVTTTQEKVIASSEALADAYKAHILIICLIIYFHKNQYDRDDGRSSIVRNNKSKLKAIKQQIQQIKNKEGSPYFNKMNWYLLALGLLDSTESYKKLIVPDYSTIVDKVKKIPVKKLTKQKDQKQVDFSDKKNKLEKTKKEVSLFALSFNEKFLYEKEKEIKKNVTTLNNGIRTYENNISFSSDVKSLFVANPKGYGRSTKLKIEDYAVRLIQYLNRLEKDLSAYIGIFEMLNYANEKRVSHNKKVSSVSRQRIEKIKTYRM